MDLDRVLMRAAPFAGLGGLFWVAYRLMTVRVFRFLDGVALLTLLVVMYDHHGTATRLAKMEDERGG
jgi:hypothetical protein